MAAPRPPKEADSRKGRASTPGATRTSASALRRGVPGVWRCGVADRRELASDFNFKQFKLTDVQKTAFDEIKIKFELIFTNEYR